MRPIILLLSIILAGCFFDSFNYDSTAPANVFKNKDFRWTTDSSSHIKYYFAPNSSAANNIDSIKIKSERNIERVLTLAHEHQYNKPISLLFVASRSRMKELIGHEINAGSNWKYNAIFHVYGDSVKVLGPHEFSHVVVTNLWGENSSYYWLGEGFAVYSDDAWATYNLHVLCKYLLDNNKLLSIQILRNDFDNYSSKISYPESGSFVKFLYEKYGCQKIKRLWQEGEGKVEEIFGKSFEGLEEEWIEILRGYTAQEVKYKI